MGNKTVENRFNLNPLNGRGFLTGSGNTTLLDNYQNANNLISRTAPWLRVLGWNKERRLPQRRAGEPDTELFFLSPKLVHKHSWIKMENPKATSPAPDTALPLGGELNVKWGGIHKYSTVTPQTKLPARCLYNATCRSQFLGAQLPLHSGSLISGVISC